MKKSLNILIMLMVAGTFLFTSCNKEEENDLPEFTGISLSQDNTTLTLTFSEPVYANSDATGALDATDFDLTISSSEISASFSVSHTAGSATVTMALEFSSSTMGDETITVKPVDGASIYDADGEAMEATESITSEALALNYYGIVGEWEAYDISLVLVGLGYDDSLYATFNDDLTYEVTAFVSGIAYVLEGTYSQEPSSNGDIWTITANQTEFNGQPYEVTSQGIFQVYTASPDSMWYEVAQVNPAIAGVTAPTAEAGFGSTSGGAFGMMNIQKYVRKD